MLVTTQSYDRREPTPFGYLVEIDETSYSVRRAHAVETPVDSRVAAEGRVKSGLRGIHAWDGLLYVASWNRVVVLRADSLEHVREISHPWMSDLHGIRVDEHGLWITSSLPDAVILYDLDGHPRSSIWFPETRTYARPQTVPKDIDWRWKGKDFKGFKEFHANHVNVADGWVYVTGRTRSHRSGKVVRIPVDSFLTESGPSPDAVEVWATGLHGPHDGLFLGPNYLVTETKGSTIASIDPRGKRARRVKVKAPEEDVVFDGIADRTASFVKQRLLGRAGKRVLQWTRGLAATPDRVFVGQSTWEGDPVPRARVVILDAGLEYVAEVPIPCGSDYPEPRIFQVYAGGDINVPNARLPVARSASAG